MGKDKNQKGALFAMLQNSVGTKQIPQEHRGPILCLLGNAVYPDQRDDRKASFLVRLAFADYGDLTIDDRCLDYLKAVKKSLEAEFGFDEMDADEVRKLASPETENNYKHYVKWLAIEATFNFLYSGDCNEYDDGYTPISFEEQYLA